AAVSEAADKRNLTAEAANITRLTAIDVRIAIIDDALKARFPDFAALSWPAPLSVQEVQAQLRTDEALVLFLPTNESKPTPKETFVWVVSKSKLRWARSEAGLADLTDVISALRCGLDVGKWDDDVWSERCRRLVGVTPQRDAAGNLLIETLPFDTARAYTLYKSLFSEVEDLIKGKHLLIVPSGPLAQLPFQLLVTRPAKD